MDYNHHNKQKTRLAKNLDKTTCDYTNCLFTQWNEFDIDDF